jgi:formylglycine-generating enzyme required for sulfatase activity
LKNLRWLATYAGEGEYLMAKLPVVAALLFRWLTLASVAVAVLALAQEGRAQGWVQRTMPTAPSARNSSPAAFDVYRGITTLFGGYNGTSTPLADTWEYNGVAWSPRITSVRPSGRWGHAMAFDQKRGRVVLFGGVSAAGMLGDTWEWDGFTWTQRVLSNAPSMRGLAAMAYDAARGVCVLFGGANPNWTGLADTWEYDGSAWTQRSVTGAPSARYRAACAWDEVRRETLVFGGGVGGQIMGDLWGWNGTTWSQKVTPTAPPAGWDVAMAFDGNCGHVVLFGGADGTWATNYGGSWAWDGAAWTQLGGSQPPARHAPTVVHDAQRGQFVVWGGRDAAGFRNDTWELGPSCSRTMVVVAPPVVGQTAQFRYDYPAAAGNLHFCWTLLTPRQSLAIPLPIPGLPSIGLCRVDVFNVLWDPATLLDGSGSLGTALSIPNNPALTGVAFDIQSVDMDLFTLTLRWAGNDLEFTTSPPPVPAANFTISTQNGIPPLAVNFTDTSTNGPTSWEWDFDSDGVVDSTSQNPSWTYLANGFYSVRLTATNSFGSGARTWTYCVYVGSLPTPPTMSPINPGTFVMGSALPAAPIGPVHLVTITYPFWMGVAELTQSEYQAIMGLNPSTFAYFPDSWNRPVENVSQSDAVTYCSMLTAAMRISGSVPLGYEYRLPTEAEWEYCCRAGTATEWHTGTGLWTSQANFGGAWAQTMPSVGSLSGPPYGTYAMNGFGLYSMHGNVAELCYAHSYASTPVVDPLVGNLGFVLRGGAYMDPSSCCRSAYRGGVCGNYGQGGAVGFRVVLGPILTY